METRTTLLLRSGGKRGVMPTEDGLFPLRKIAQSMCWEETLSSTLRKSHLCRPGEVRDWLALVLIISAPAAEVCRGSLRSRGQCIWPWNGSFAPTATAEPTPVSTRGNAVNIRELKASEAFACSSEIPAFNKLRSSSPREKAENSRSSQGSPAAGQFRKEPVSALRTAFETPLGSTVPPHCARGNPMKAAVGNLRGKDLRKTGRSAGTATL